MKIKNLNIKEWFNVVEVEVNSRCNRECSYCPVSILPPPDVPEYMEREVFDRILDELVRIGFSGKLSYHLYSEPLLRDDLEELVNLTKSKLPSIYQLLFTNGTLLSDQRYHRLRQSGIDHFIVTKHDWRPIIERNFQTVQYPKDLVISNRGGVLFETDIPLEIPCYAPSELLIITVTGDVLLCCNDAKRECVMGNIVNQSLEDIWFSRRMTHIRNLLKNGKRKDAASICKKCNDKEFVEFGNA